MPRPSAASTFRSALRGGHRRPALSRASSIGCRCSTTSSRRCSTIWPTRHLARPLGRGVGGGAAGPDRGILRRPQRGARRWRISARRPTSRCRRTGSISAASEWATALADHAPVLQLTAVRGAANRRQRRSSRSAAGRAAASPPSGPKRGATSIEAVRAHADALRKAGKRVVIAAWTEGSRERLETHPARS